MSRVRRYPASEQDKPFVLALRFAPETRAAALSGTPRSGADTWWAAVKPDLWVLKEGQERTGRAIGYFIARPATEISIVLAPASRGRGIGTNVLVSLPFEDLIAFIRPRNRASVRAFEKAGFVRDEGRGKCLVYRKQQHRPSPEAA